MGAVFPGVLCCLVKMSLVLCQDLAGSWYARCEHGPVGARVSDFKGSMVQMRA